MSPTGSQNPRSRLRAHAHSYLRAVIALALNLPLLSIALYRHLDQVPLLSAAGLYAGLVFAGYYALILLAVITIAFSLLPFSRRLATALSGAILTASLFYLLVNSVVHGVFKFHLDAFWLEYIVHNYDGIGVLPSLAAAALAGLVFLTGMQWLLFRLAARLRHRTRLAGGFGLVVIAAFLASQAVHVVAYQRNDARITSITPQLPFFYPVVSHKHAARYAGLVPLAPALAPGGASRGPTSIRYPLREFDDLVRPGARRLNVLLIVLESWRADMMDRAVSPHISAFAETSTECLRHFSSGNSTPMGIFGLFYGIHPTYWNAVKANSTTIDDPLLIDALKANGYAFGIYADSHFERHKIKDTIFRGIEVHESFAGSTPDAKDADLTRQLLGFMAEQHRTRRPFFGFAFYKSTHYSYYCPPGDAPFQPSQELNVALAGRSKDTTPYLNHYRNAIHYVDGLVGSVLAGLDSLGLANETAVIITSDHGEEFNDNHAGYWGHSGNFTRYQTQVPMIAYLPGKPPRRVQDATAHVDVPVTLLEEALGFNADPRSYSNGRNLFGPLGAPRPIVVGGYVNHAFIFDDNVYAVFPVYVQRYKLGDINAPAAPPRTDLMGQAMEETHRFYGGRATRGPLARAGSP